MQSSLEQLMSHFAAAGTVEWIGIRPGKKAFLVSVNNVMLDPSYGLEGDHYAGRSGKRQVTLIQAEHLPAIASMMNRERVTADQLRRNIIVSGLNLLALKNKSFQLGEAILDYTGACQPCSRMETTLGFGGYNAMRGHGGITARVVHAGMVTVGDAVIAVQ
ncbi:MAG: MOSC domain-containing protein [Gammaproteobacteria bacterium]